MRNLALVFTLAIAAALPAMAIASGHDRSHYGKHSYMARGLDLTEQQKTEAKKLQRDAMEAKHQLRKDLYAKVPEADRKAYEAQMEKLKAENKEKFRALLTDEQKAKLDARQSKKAERKAEWQAFKKWQAEQKN